MISFRKVLKHNFWKVASLNDGSNTEKYIDYSHNILLHALFYKSIDNINKTNPFPPRKYYYYDKKDINYDKDKLVISKKGYLMPYIDDTQNYTYSDNFKIIVDNKKNLKNILKIIDSCLVKYLIKQFSKHGFDNINALELISEKIEDEKDVFKIYKLTESEKNHINHVINC